MAPVPCIGTWLQHFSHALCHNVPAGPPPPPPPPPPGALGKKKAQGDGSKDGPSANCVVLRSPTAQRQRPSSAEEQAATAEQKRRLKQLHWDKLKQAREGTVWSRANRDKLHLDLTQLEQLFQVRLVGCCGVKNACTAGL